jgi:hypothetical protein
MLLVVPVLSMTLSMAVFSLFKTLGSFWSLFKVSIKLNQRFASQERFLIEVSKIQNDSSKGIITQELPRAFQSPLCPWKIILLTLSMLFIFSSHYWLGSFWIFLLYLCFPVFSYFFSTCISFMLCLASQYCCWVLLLLPVLWEKLSMLASVWHWPPPSAWSWWSHWGCYDKWSLL